MNMGNQIHVHLLILLCVSNGRLALGGDNQLSSYSAMRMETLRQHLSPEELAKQCPDPVPPEAPPPDLPTNIDLLPYVPFPRSGPQLDPTPPYRYPRSNPPVHNPDRFWFHYNGGQQKYPRSNPPVHNPDRFWFHYNGGQQSPDGIPLSFNRRALETDPPPINPDLGIPLSFDRTAWGTDPPPHQRSIGLEPPIETRQFSAMRNNGEKNRGFPRGLAFGRRQFSRRNDGAKYPDPRLFAYRRNGADKSRKQLFDREWQVLPTNNPYQRKIPNNRQYRQLPMTDSNPARKTWRKSTPGINDSDSEHIDEISSQFPDKWMEKIAHLMLLTLLSPNSQ